VMLKVLLGYCSGEGAMGNVALTGVPVICCIFGPQAYTVVMSEASLKWYSTRLTAGVGLRVQLGLSV